LKKKRGLQAKALTTSLIPELLTQILIVSQTNKW